MSQHNKNKNKNNTAKQQQSCIYMLQQHNKMKTSLVSTEARHNIHIVYAASCSEQQSTQTTTIAATKYAQSRNGNMPNMRSCLRCQTYHIEAANKASQPATAFPPPC